MILWEFPLALASFLFHGLIKNFMRVVLILHDARSGKEAEKWIVLSQDDMLARPGALPLIMTTAPRWNTHAILATLSPVDVSKFLDIERASADRSAASWTIVICTYAGRQTVTSIGSLSPSAANGKVRIELAPGKYWLGLRYYERRGEVELPAVSADGQPVAAAQIISAGTNDFYRDLFKRSSFFYLALHYYVFVLLRYRSFFPESFVRREFLPMGNPETQFVFGALRRNEQLLISVEPQAFADWNVLVTIYNRASFPIQSEHLRTPEFQITAPADCTYLFRVNRKSDREKTFPKDWLRLQVTKS
jgi:hypothetical protein